MDFYLKKGEERIKALETAVNSHKEDTIIVTDACEADPPEKFMDMFKVESYKIEPDFGQKAGKYPELGQLNSADIGFEFDSNSKITEYTVRWGEDNKGEIINAGGYSMDGIFIIASQAFKANDKLPKDSQERVPNNEMTWQAFAKAASKRNTKKLQGMILRDIQNKGTWEILRQAYSAKDIPLSQHATWESDAHDKVKTEWFTRLVGSDNIGGKLLTMSNHHKAMGNKEIKKITTYPRQIGEKTKGKLTMVLTLG